MKYKDIKIIYEDNHLLVVEKPSGILTQADDTKDLDMYNLLKEYIRVEYNKPGEAWLGIVHRLDQPVAGVMVFAKTSKAASRLSNQIRLNEWKKQYLVITDNVPHENKAIYTDYLYKDRRNNNSYVVDKNHPNSKYSVLSNEVISTNENKALLKVDLETGRSHQIRVQLASRNIPIYGDFRYNDKPKKNSDLKLFAYKLEIIHPTKKERMTFMSKPKLTGQWIKFKKELDQL